MTKHVNDLIQKSIDVPSEKLIVEYVIENKRLEKRIEELEQQIEQMQDANCTSCTELGGMQLKINRLEQQIEKMKICQNCKSEDNDYMEKPCCDCSRCLGGIKRQGTSDKWELQE